MWCALAYISFQFMMAKSLYQQYHLPLLWITARIFVYISCTAVIITLEMWDPLLPSRFVVTPQYHKGPGSLKEEIHKQELIILRNYWTTFNKHIHAEFMTNSMNDWGVWGVWIDKTRFSFYRNPLESNILQSIITASYFQFVFLSREVISSKITNYHCCKV